MLYRTKYTFISILLTVATVACSAFADKRQPSTQSVEEVVKASHNPLFEINRSNIIEDESLLKIGTFADSLHINGLLRRFEICGFSSPDGPEAFNASLAYDRAKAIRSFFHNKYKIPYSLFKISSVGEDWNKTRELVSTSSMQGKEDVLAIIDNTADKAACEKRLRTLDNGRPWQVLAREVFPHVRRAEMGVYYNEGELHATLSGQGTQIEEPVAHEPAVDPELEPESDPEVMPEPAQVPEMDPCGFHQWHIGTNIVEWAMAITNLTGEYDFARRWSVALSLHYSAWNYGTTTRKFRTFILRPEVRYWLHDCHKGFFINAHVQLAAYNFALPGWHYRIQDVDGKHPALGGGIGLGYRVDLDKERRWAFQADLGAGIYYLKYNRFENRRNGPLVDTRSRVWAGIDHFGLSIIYNFKPRKQ